jgi:outer membrane protein TolC
MKKQCTAKASSAHRLLVVLTVASLGLVGCTVGPDYVRPEAGVNPSWIESAPTLQEEPAEIREWWTAFNDPVLTRLVHEAYEQNLSLRAAGLRVIQARAARGVAVGYFFPQEQ